MVSGKVTKVVKPTVTNIKLPVDKIAAAKVATKNTTDKKPSAATKPIPKMYLYIGGAVLLLGALWFMFRKKRR